MKRKREEELDSTGDSILSKKELDSRKMDFLWTEEGETRLLEEIIEARNFLGAYQMVYDWKAAWKILVKELRKYPELANVTLKQIKEKSDALSRTRGINFRVAAPQEPKLNLIYHAYKVVCLPVPDHGKPNNRQVRAQAQLGSPTLNLSSTRISNSTTNASACASAGGSGSGESYFSGKEEYGRKRAEFLLKYQNRLTSWELATLSQFGDYEAFCQMSESLADEPFITYLKNTCKHPPAPRRKKMSVMSMSTRNSPPFLPVEPGSDRS